MTDCEYTDILRAILAAEQSAGEAMLADTAAEEDEQ